MSKTNIDLNNLPVNEKGEDYCRCSGNRSEGHGQCRCYKAHDPSKCPRSRKGGRCSIKTYCSDCLYGPKKKDKETDETIGVPDAPEPPTPTINTTKETLEMRVLRENIAFANNISDLIFGRMNDSAVPNEIQDKMLLVLEKKNFNKNEIQDIRELDYFLLRQGRNNSNQEYNSLFKILQHFVDKVISGPEQKVIVTVPSSVQASSSAEAIQQIKNTRDTPAVVKKVQKVAPTPREIVYINSASTTPAQRSSHKVPPESSNVPTSEQSEQEEQSEHESEQSEQGEQSEHMSEQEEPTRPTEDEEEEEEIQVFPPETQPPGPAPGPPGPPPPPAPSSAPGTSTSVQPEVQEPKQLPTKRGRSPSTRQPRGKTSKKKSSTDLAFEYNEGTRIIQALQKKKGMTEAEAVFHAHEFLYETDPNEELQIYKSSLSADLFRKPQENAAGGYCFIYSVFDSLIELTKNNAEIKLRLENTKGLKGLLTPFRFAAFEDERVLNKSKKERLTSRLVGIIDDDLIKDKFFRNKLEEKLMELSNQKLKKLVIHRYKEGWGINDEADAYLIRKLLGIDIIIYKDILETEKIYHAISYSVEMSENRIPNWDPSDPVQLESKYKSSINLLNNTGGIHFVSLIPKY